ncbi:nitrite/sulfite reductase [Desulfuromonas versatilis]|nr:nitrite/sulfite reductase [Desulfuromonas versatilis]
MSDTTIDYQKLRINGIYQQNAEGDLMLRVKVPAGVISAEQTEKVCAIAERFSNGKLHLTSRGSIEIHWLRYENLAEVTRMLAAVGLTSRGACGGAVRGISCSTTFAAGFGTAQVLARKLHRHFAGNPHFEGLPKKFKIGVDAGYQGARHLIQDVGLVYLGSEEGRELYDVWVAGGLGRQPQPGFLFANRVAEKRLLPIIEAVVRVYKANGQAGKRLKHLLNDIGEARLRDLVAAEMAAVSALEIANPLPEQLTAKPQADSLEFVEVPVFAGEISAEKLRALARVAAQQAEGFLALTADQNLALLPGEGRPVEAVRQALAAVGLAGPAPEEAVSFRICPGSHECRMGLAPVRDVARELIGAMGGQARSGRWAISGCPNSCSQPQLADFGIVTVKKVAGEDGERRPLFDLLRREGEGFGEPVQQGIGLEELVAAVGKLT